MSSAVISTSAAQRRLFIFDDESAPEVGSVGQNTRASLKRIVGGSCPRIIETLQSKIRYQKSAIPLAPASQLTIRPVPEMVPSGIAALDALTGGLPRGCITEIYGSVSSGRTSILLAVLAAATRRGECCAVMDATAALDPHSVVAAGVGLEHLLWVRCGESSPRKNHSPQSRTEKAQPKLKNQPPFRDAKYETEHRLEQVLRATDLLLESGGFGLIALDLADVPPESARRIPLTTWFRFRRAIEHTRTILLVIEPLPIAGSCSSLVLQLGAPNIQCPVPSSKPSHSHLLTGLEITVELIRSRLDRKPAGSVAFETRTAWAG
jgi:hypothetical protein